MQDLRELYQQVILDHCKKPRNRRGLGEGSHHADGYNPLCGDKVTVYLDVDGDTVRDVSFEGSGCAISTASASMMTEALKGKPLAEVDELFREFHELITGNGDTAPAEARLGKLVVFAGVREFPVRVKCATLAWHTMRAALRESDEPVTTE